MPSPFIIGLIAGLATGLTIAFVVWLVMANMISEFKEACECWKQRYYSVRDTFASYRTRMMNRVVE